MTEPYDVDTVPGGSALVDGFNTLASALTLGQWEMYVPGTQEPEVGD